MSIAFVVKIKETLVGDVVVVVAVFVSRDHKRGRVIAVSLYLPFVSTSVNYCPYNELGLSYRERPV